MGNKNLSPNKGFGGINQRPSINARPATPASKVMPGQVKPTATPVVAKRVATTTPVNSNTALNQTKPVAAASAADKEMNAFISNMKNMVGSFAYVSDEVVANNAKLAAGNGMTIDDRKIPFECAQYILSNFAFICMGIVFDADFKESFIHAVTAEQNIDALPEDEKKKIRESMTDPTPYQSEGSIILGMTNFTPPIEDQLHKQMMAGFDKLQPYSKEFDEAVAALTDNQKIENGFIFSNWMYLIRAFTHNDMFMSYVITVIDKVKERLGVK